MSGSGAPAAVVCAECGTEMAPDARFCEACGADLPGEPAAACRECGGVVDGDGYCTTCGAKAPRERDHATAQPQPWLAAVCDKGIRHLRNEDAVAVAAGAEPGGRAAMVVCDGVTSACDSDVASLAAARAALDVLWSRAGDPPPDDLGSALGARLVAATDAAAAAVTATARPEHGDSPPSCTFVAAVVEDGLVVVGVVGDSRAYWVPDDGAGVGLTVDDSWAAQQIAAGTPREVAETGPRAHAITRWLGLDAPDHTPRLTSLLVDRPGWLVLCSDGLWNYCSAADDLAALVRSTAAAAKPEPLATASALVDWANAQGGHDNITVALARLGAC